MQLKYTMNLVTEDADFVPINFVVCNFYGEDICFCWNEDKLIMFPYAIRKYTSPLKVLFAPGPVKTIQCFSSRVFFTCLPRGVYKLSRDGRFSVLSKSAISIGSIFFEILILKNNDLYLENKQNKSSKLLLHLPSTLHQLEELCTFSLHLENSEQNFRSILLDDDNDTIENLCLIGGDKKLFTLSKERIRLIYSCDNQITSIVPIQNDGKANGLILTTNTDAIIVVFAKDKALCYKKLYLGVEIKTLSAVFDQHYANKVWILYSDESKLYYMTLMLSTEISKRIKTEEKSFTCVRHYKQNKFIGLTKQKNLYELSTAIDFTQPQEDDFINLHSGMLKGSNLMVDKICEKAKELQSWNEILLKEEDKLYRINLYACKKKIQIFPKMTVHRIAKRLFLNINFQENLSKNIYIACSLTSNNETIFSIKEVTDNETSIDLPVSKKKLSNSLKIGMDLVTMMNKGEAWFIVRDFMIDPVVEKRKKKQSKKDKTSFINAKINLIRNLMATGNLTMKKLSEIKKSIRKEMCDI